MQAYETALTGLLGELDSRPHRQGRDKASIDKLVADALASPSLRHESASENWKPHWEYVLRDEVFKLAVRVLLLALCSEGTLR